MPAASDALHCHLADAFPTTMQAVRLNPPGGLDALSLDHIATPQAGPGEVLVRVHAAAITRDELTWSTDRLPIIPSFEVSGVVAALGTDVTSIRAGEAVFALTPFDRQGVAAEFAAIPAAMLAPKPAGLTDVAAAATPMPALTAWQALFDHGALRAGQRVLITGAAGGVGHVGVQLARWRGAHVIAIAPAARHDLVRQLGANEVTDRQTALTSGGIDPVDLIFDTTGGELLAASPRLLASGGRTVTVVES
ncbi:MAG: NADP-dependent oxidoreductase, partial [Gemmatimonadales bacterium]